MNLLAKPKLEKSYHIPLPLFDKAFRAFQKKYVYPRNIVITLLLVAVAGVYVDAAVRDPSSTMAYVLIFICAAMIMVMWYNPMKLRRNLMISLKELENDVYTVSLYQDGVTIRTEDGVTETAEDTAESEPVSEAVEAKEEPAENHEDTDENGFNDLFDDAEAPAVAEPIPATELPFGTGFRILEYDEFFMLYLVKHNFYVVPKKDFSAEEQQILRDGFGDSLLDMRKG